MLGAMDKVKRQTQIIQEDNEVQQSDSYRMYSIGLYLAVSVNCLQLCMNSLER